MQHYPEAKVVLTTRDPEQCIPENPPPDHNHPHWNRILKLAEIVIMEKDLKMKEGARHDIIKRFQEQENRVKDTIPPGKLLIYHVSEGWERLCKFVDVVVPFTPFRHDNTTKDFFPVMQSLYDALPRIEPAN
ncbi:hypothetical protein EC973_000406 [Apophysomyces ossiformis]|uniref:Uncharacterized protein n=1 Tax=Apophysomyces ossiformis TaxID=679940 RepID=A0A8H7ENV6_9FUNG|nr:hypothetical protein EC973_000406 [Apophysomyces ossiformis]